MSKNSNYTKLDKFIEKMLESAITAIVLFALCLIPTSEIIYNGIRSNPLISNFVALGVSLGVALVYLLMYKHKKKIDKKLSAQLNQYVNTYYLYTLGKEEILNISFENGRLHAFVKDNDGGKYPLSVHINKSSRKLICENELRTYIIHYTDSLNGNYVKLVVCDKREVKATIFAMRIIPQQLFVSNKNYNELTDDDIHKLLVLCRDEFRKDQKNRDKIINNAI
jgi:hypothetical protein